MVDDSLEFATSEYTSQNLKLNRKSIFVGNSTQITNLSVTTPGMLVYSTTTGGGFVINSLYERDAANTVWDIVNFSESAEANSTPTAADTSALLVAGTRYYNFFTLPTTDKFYLITGIEWFNDSVVAGTVMSGVDVIDADPPVQDNTPLMALAQEVIMAGTNQVQRASDISSKAIRGGTLCGVWFAGSNATARTRQDGTANVNNRKAMTYNATPFYANNDVWNSAAVKRYVKAYYRGYI